MPKFSISCWVNNKGTATVSAHVGASLVNVNDGIEYYNTADDVKKNFKRDVVKRLIRLMEFRNRYPAFDGEFDIHSSNDTSLILSWTKGKYHARLTVDLTFKTATIRYFDQATQKTKGMRL